VSPSRVVSGIGALAFGILTVVGLALINPPGGTYSAHDISKYLERGHRAAVFTGLYVEILATLGLLLALAYVCTLGPPRWNRFAWLVGVIAAAAILVGFAVMASGAVARAYGGNDVVVSPATSYVVSQIGGTILWGPGAVMLGVALVLLAAGPGGFPSWLRWVTLAAGILGLASPAFFPSLALLLWAIVAGIWMLASGRDEPRGV
jgi:hypothetical protein